jgi:hypothetical protein
MGQPSGHEAHKLGLCPGQGLEPLLVDGDQHAVPGGDDGGGPWPVRQDGQLADDGTWPKLAYGPIGHIAAQPARSQQVQLLPGLAEAEEGLARLEVDEDALGEHFLPGR